MKNRILKFTLLLAAMTGGLSLGSCQSSSHGYKSGSTETISAILNELSEENKTLESVDKTPKDASIYSEVVTLGKSFFSYTSNSRTYIHREFDLTYVCDVTNAYKYGIVFTDYLYVRKNTGREYNNYSIYETKIYSVQNDDEKKQTYTEIATYYSASSNPAYANSEPRFNINNGKYRISNHTNYVTYLSTREDMGTYTQTTLTVEPTTANIVTNTTSDDEEEKDIDYEKVYRYPGYTFDEDIKQYIKKIEYNGYTVIYHKAENGNDLSTITVGDNSVTNNKMYIWQEDITLSEKDETTNYTYYDSDSGTKHLVKTYYSNIDTGVDSKEIDTEFIISSQSASSDNYLVLEGRTINDDKIIEGKNKTYFLDNDANIVYTTLFNEDYDNVVKVSSNMYKINNKLFDSNLEYLDKITYLKNSNVFVSDTAIYDLTGNVISKGPYSVAGYNAIYSSADEKYYGVVNNRLIAYKGDYHDSNTNYNLDITMTKYDSETYLYTVKTLSGNTLTTFYSEDDSPSFNYSDAGSYAKMTTNSEIYTGITFSSKSLISFIAFSF